ncbi:Flp pilus assembly pilin Flp [Bradyrhizobium barranii subsp. barranii]
MTTSDRIELALILVTGAIALIAVFSLLAI